MEGAGDELRISSLDGAHEWKFRDIQRAGDEIRISSLDGAHEWKFRVFKERVMRFELTNGTLGRYCLTTWRHPQL